MDNRRSSLLELLGKRIHVEVDRPVGYRHGDIVYPVNYGWVPGLMGGDGEEQDAYILGVNTPVTSFDGQVIAVAFRENDCEDKLIVAQEGTVLHQGQIAKKIHFQEQFFDTHIVSLFQKSCGVLPYRSVGDKREYLIVFEQFSKCWSLPKGHMEAGETEQQTAHRELMEETGLTVILEDHKQATIEYPVSPVSRKQVVLFTGQVTGTPRVREGEIERYRWISPDEFSHYLHADTVQACRTLL